MKWCLLFHKVFPKLQTSMKGDEFKLSLSSQYLLIVKYDGTEHIWKMLSWNTKKLFFPFVFESL